MGMLAASVTAVVVLVVAVALAGAPGGSRRVLDAYLSADGYATCSPQGVG